jgi:hypothetical protein
MMAVYGGLQAALRRGQQRLRNHVSDEVLVPPATVAAAWRISPAALDEAAQQGELPQPLIVDGLRYYSCQLVELDFAAARRLGKALRPLTASEAFIFLARAHGALAGRTVVDALSAGVTVERVIALAEAWAAQATCSKHGERQ